MTLQERQDILLGTESEATMSNTLPDRQIDRMEGRLELGASLDYFALALALLTQPLLLLLRVAA